MIALPQLAENLMLPGASKQTRQPAGFTDKLQYAYQALQIGTGQ